jgi:phosphoglycerate dehydrogenase-like enzyme
MSERLKVVLVPIASKPQLFEPWGRDFVDAIGSRHELTVFDHSAPLEEQLRDADVVVDLGGSATTREMLDASRTARLWQCLSTGLDHFDLDYWKSKGMPVANTPGPFSATALAECAFMLMLMLARRYPEARQHFASRIMNVPMGSELAGKSLGLIGFGASGREVAKRATAFGMNVLAVDVRTIPPEDAQQFGVQNVGGISDIDALVREADYVSLHVPLESSTRHLLDRKRLQLMKPTACIINVARGALIDEPALEEALHGRKIAGAGLDVFSHEPPDPDNPLYSLPNVIVTPHIAGSTRETSQRRAQAGADNVDRIARGMDPQFVVS